VKISMI